MYKDFLKKLDCVHNMLVFLWLTVKPEKKPDADSLQSKVNGISFVNSETRVFFKHRLFAECQFPQRIFLEIEIGVFEAYVRRNGKKSCLLFYKAVSFS